MDDPWIAAFVRSTVASAIDASQAQPLCELLLTVPTRLERSASFAQCRNAVLEMLRSQSTDLPQGTVSSVSTASRQVATRTLERVARHYSEAGLKLAIVAKQERISAAHLSRAIKRCYGIGFGQYLHRTRVSAAAHLLQTTRLSVKEIAAAVGYNRTTGLDRHFKQIHSITPVEYRAMSVTQDRSTDITK